MYKSPDYQQSLIPIRATALARRLFKALSPLIGVQSTRSKKRSKLHTAWVKEVPRLKRVFGAALRLKSRTMTGDWCYEVILPTSGAMFQKQSMRVEEGDCESGSVLLALAPGISCYRQPKRTVDSNSFCRPHTAPNVDPVWTHKAVVLVS